MSMIDIPGTPYCYEESRRPAFQSLADRVRQMRSTGRLSPDVLHRIRRFFRLKDIYHSNAIEGNLLKLGETRQVVELGLTITGKPLKDQAEARNLSHALDFLEELAGVVTRPITGADIRQIHAIVLRGISPDAGTYRTVPVEISGSDYSPPAPESLLSEMEEYAAWLSDASVPDRRATLEGLTRAAIAHTWFVMIHPFTDGNGRVARLLMNSMLIRYGFPIAIMTKEDRRRYYDALETSQTSDLTPFISLLAECIEESLEEYEYAAREQKEQTEWAQSIAATLTQPERIRAQNEYEVWRNAMELFKSYLKQTVDVLRDQPQIGTFARIYFTDFGTIDFEKYAILRRGHSAKRTWFCRLDFISGNTSARYLFFCGAASDTLAASGCTVTLCIAREEPQNSYNYERLDRLSPMRVPVFVEIGYEMKEERFVARKRGTGTQAGRVEDLGSKFLTDVVERHFKS